MSRQIHSANLENERSARILSTIRSQTDKISRNSTTKSRVSAINSEEQTNLIANRTDENSAGENLSIDIMTQSNIALNQLDHENNNIDKPQTATPSNSIVLSNTKKVNNNTEDITSVVTELVNEINYNQEEVLVKKSFTDLNEMEIKEIEMYKCLHDEISICDCCKTNNHKTKNVNNKEHPTTPITPDNDIFHLTAHDDLEYEDDGYDNDPSELLRKQRSIDFEREEKELIHKHDLRDILLANYDRRFAAKIGITDFIPIEIISGQGGNSSRPLEFIPFESIDRSYPK